MAQCYDSQLNKFVYCSSSFGTYMYVRFLLIDRIIIVFFVFV